MPWPIGTIAKLGSKRGGAFYKGETAYGPGGLTRGGQLASLYVGNEVKKGADEHKKRRGAIR